MLNYRLEIFDDFDSYSGRVLNTGRVSSPSTKITRKLAVWLTSETYLFYYFNMAFTDRSSWIDRVIDPASPYPDDCGSQIEAKKQRAERKQREAEEAKPDPHQELWARYLVYLSWLYRYILYLIVDALPNEYDPSATSIGSREYWEWIYTACSNTLGSQSMCPMCIRSTRKRQVIESIRGHCSGYKMHYRIKKSENNETPSLRCRMPKIPIKRLSTRLGRIFKKLRNY